MKKELIGFCAAAVFIPPLATSCSDKAADNERPNILFILSDDHTAQSWGLYGGILAPYAKNENIARLAREGCVVDNCFCTNSISVPSRAALLTGQYSQMNGVYTLDDALEPERDNIAKQLQAVGYQTALIGKWHLKKKPAGFDYFSVFHDQGEYYDPVFKTAEGWIDDSEGVSGTKEQGFSTDLVTGKTIDWLKNRDREKPFMMFCHFKATHEPWDFPERMRHLYDGVEFPEPQNMMEFGPETSARTIRGQQLENLGGRWETASKDPDSWWCRYPELPFSTEGMDRETARRKIYGKLIRDYLRCAAAIDDNIGRLLSFLDDEGLSKNTIVVYISDQGYFLGEHGFFDKRIMYEEALRMPMVVRYPREIPAGVRNNDLILNVDFAATLADYANASPPRGNQGTSFRANLRGETPADWRESIYYRYWTQHDIRPAHMGIRNKRHKLIFFYGDKLNTRGSSNFVSRPSWEFYDLEKDPREDRNAYSDPQYSAVIADMKAEMLKLRNEWNDTDAGSGRMKAIMDEFYR
ncbi:MAG: sulfatase [Prolixibacteraceae bacterium]|nr:sulfatase [Prolixibacteraceae bacterium]